MDTHARADIDQSCRPLSYNYTMQQCNWKGNSEMYIPLARQSCVESWINYDELTHNMLLCLTLFLWVITAEWCFPNPINKSRNASIIGLSPSESIRATSFTWHTVISDAYCPCVFSCHFEIKMTPIMTMKSGLRDAVVSLQRHQHSWDSQKPILCRSNDNTFFFKRF